MSSYENVYKSQRSSTPLIDEYNVNDLKNKESKEKIESMKMSTSKESQKKRQDNGRNRKVLLETDFPVMEKNLTNSSAKNSQQRKIDWLNGKGKL